MDEQTLRKVLREELSGYATKKDLEGLATKQDLQNFITKDDLKAALKETAIQVTKDISSVVTGFFQQTENLKADKTQTLSHEVRIQNLEAKVFPQ